MMRLLILVVCVFSYVSAEAGAGLQTCQNNVACHPSPSDGAIECSGDCSCRDNIVDECQRPHPTTSVHVQNIQDCMLQCEVFSIEDRCKFIIYHYDNIDENCIIMNNDFDDYVGHCNQRGQPLWGLNPGQGLARWSVNEITGIRQGCSDDTTCTNDAANPTHKCNTCTDCNEDECRGFLLSSCNIFSDVLETSEQTSWDHCEIWARTTGLGPPSEVGKTTYAFYNKEQGECEVYGDVYNEQQDQYNGFDRVCKVAFVELGTDPVHCSEIAPPPSPTPPPPQCIKDDDCKDGEICNVAQICVPGCRTDEDCHKRPCDCSGNCVNPTVECEYCETSGSTNGEGHCEPGCATKVDCKAEEICNGMHLCFPAGAMLIDTLTMTTDKCDGCDGTEVETGASILIKGFFEGSAGCYTGNLDHEDRVDYEAGATRTFTSDPKELGQCISGNMDGYIITMFTVTWKGAGSWTPSAFSVSFTGTAVKANCVYSGPALATGKSATIDCANGY